MADAESISIEETNKIRIALGLKPLIPVSQATKTTDEDGNVVLTADDEERKAMENLKSLRAEQARAAEEEALRLRLKKAKDRKALNEKLSGQTLGQALEGENEDLRSWIRRTKKSERELAERRARELEYQDQQFQNEYTEEHLEGLKVGHGFDDIEEGEGMILTIKDREILDEDDEGDVLISTALVEKERLKENLDNKVRKPKYDPYAEDYNPETGERKLLSKYDEEIEGKKEKTFILGRDYQTRTPKPQEDSGSSRAPAAISLDYDGPKEIASDYVDPSSIKIKKPKKKKSKNTTRLSTLIDGEGLRDSSLSVDNLNLEHDVGPIPLSSSKRAHDDDSGLGDDDELQEILAKRRRQALKKRKFARPEDIVWNIRQSSEDGNTVSMGAGALIIDDTSEFVRGLEMSQMEEGDPRDEDIHSGGNGEDMNINVTGNNDVEMPDEEIGVSEYVTEGSENVPSSVLNDEPLMVGSMAATLAALRRTGEIGKENSTSNFTMEELAKREEILAQQQLRKMQREADTRQQRELERQSERFNRMSQREREQYREQENQTRERHEAQQRMREFEDFKFNVELEYKDDFGQEMSKKDAFKRLSHTFHGKSSGTMKKGKYLQKVLGKMKSMEGSIVGDLTKVAQQREQQKKSGSAHTRIQ